MLKNEYIRNRRLALGLEELDIAKLAGISIHEYDDLEAYEDELYTVLPAEKIARVCLALKIKLVDLLDLYSDESVISKDIVRLRMNDMKLSTQDLSDMVGINEEAIQEVMHDIRNIKTWVIEPIIDLSKVIKVNPGNILSQID